ncbi:MAG: radical SAM protein [Humidesulfovibrio sp.]|nr:radical SAM protein [Humidesulfovibrio sp.]
MAETFADKLSKNLLNLRYAFRPGKPLLTLRLAAAVLKSWILGRPPLRYVDFAIDFACNLRCDHCFAQALIDPARTRMTPQDYRAVARQAMAMGAVNFSFQGGEPLLCSELPEIIKACSPHKNLISVTTNGTLLTQDRLEQLKALGVDILTVSLDSSIAAEHDSFRGVPGSYERTVAGVDRALAAGFRVSLGTVVTHASLRGPGLAGLIKFARDRGLLLYLILPVPAGKWMAASSMMLTQEDEGYVDELTRESPFIRIDFQANLGGYGCGAAKEILYLTPYGDVLPCPFMHISFGNARTELLAEIRAKMLANRYLDHYHGKCLVSTDAQFIKEHLSRTFTAGRLPMPAEQAFAPQSQGEH